MTRGRRVERGTSLDLAERVREQAARILRSRHATAAAKARARRVLGRPSAELEREVLDLLRSELGAEVAS